MGTTQLGIIATFNLLGSARVYSSKLNYFGQLERYAYSLVASCSGVTAPYKRLALNVSRTRLVAFCSAIIAPYKGLAFVSKIQLSLAVDFIVIPW